MNTVKTKYGIIQGIVENGYTNFKSIPYAKPPIGELRFKPLREPESWNGMSHDIRTPMNGILGMIEINQAHADGTEFTSRNRAKAKVAANYLLSLINDILQ